MGGTEENRVYGLGAGDSEFLSVLASNAGDQAKNRRRHDIAESDVSKS